MRLIDRKVTGLIFISRNLRKEPFLIVPSNVSFFYVPFGVLTETAKLLFAFFSYHW
jgi:hypothetical protein